MTTKKPRLQVLYQRLGNTWYAFANVDGELFIGKVPTTATASDAEAKAAALKQAETAALAQGQSRAKTRKPGKAA